MPNCTEVVIYRIKPGREADLAKVRAVMEQEMAALDGFLSIQSLPSASKDHEWMDTVHWASHDHALQGYEAWKSLSSVQDFMACIDVVHYTGHFLVNT